MLVYGVLYVVLEMVGQQLGAVGWPQVTALDVATALTDAFLVLAIGAAVALGETALGTLLVIGFSLHNITEGVGTAAPILKEKRPRLAHFAGLALLAGFPAILGTLLGGFAYSPLAATVFLAVGAGAILQVIYEVGKIVLKDSSAKDGVPSFSASLSGYNLLGLTAGIAIMYVTGLLV